MEIVLEPELYSPSMDDMGNYVDKIPPFSNIKNGLRCPCASRKDKCYNSQSIFSKHIQTKYHQKWLLDTNLNRANYYTENIQLKDTVYNQQLIIARMEKDLKNKILTIDYLTQMLSKIETTNDIKSTTCIDLIHFD